jgi:hypothetical protein
LTLAIDKAADAQERTNRRIQRLEYVGIAVAIVGVVLTVVQIVIAIWKP